MIPPRTSSCLRPPVLRVFLAALLLIAFAGLPGTARGTTVLQLEFKRSKGALEGRFVIDGTSREIGFTDREHELCERMTDLYDMLEKYQKNDDEDIIAELREIGSTIYGPIGSRIDSADTIAISITPALARFPFEYLNHREKPLGLQKPVIVSFGPLPTTAFSTDRIESALVLSDITADPEKACLPIAKKYRKSLYRSFKDLDLAFLEKLPKRDLLLVSGHGEVSFTDEDNIGFEDEAIYPESWARSAPMLAYFDSCQIGASRRFVEAFRDAGTIWFLAPLTSNEAGNSSTRTIEGFFSRLSAGEPPEVALLNTKIDLYEFFSRGKRVRYGKLLHQALPFRVYRLN